MKRFIAVFAVVMFVGAITMPGIAQAQAQAPAVKGTEGPDVRIAPRESPPPFALSEEVASAHWVPLQDLLDLGRQAPFPYVHEGTELVLPSIRVGGLVIWGLTYQMVELFRLVLGNGR